MTLAIGYVRVSTTGQAERGYSLDAQRKLIEAQATIDELTIISILADEGASARTIRRTGLRNVINAVEAGRVDAVVVSNIDRLSRSIVDMGRLMEIFNRSPRSSGGRGVSLISATDHFDTESATGRLTRDLLVLFAQWEREIISERTVRAHDIRREQGLTIGNPPWGYRAEDDGRLVENDLERQVLCEAWELRLEEHLTWHEVAAALNSRGYRTRAGGPWTRQAISHTAKKHAYMREEGEVT